MGLRIFERYQWRKFERYQWREYPSLPCSIICKTKTPKRKNNDKIDFIISLSYMHSKDILNTGDNQGATKKRSSF